MAVSFRSANRRAVVGGLIFSYLIDVAVAYFILRGISDSHDSILVWALIAPIGAGVITGVYGAYGAIKEWIWFYCFDKSRRVSETLAYLKGLDLPGPSSVYVDSDEYIAEVANSPTITRQAVLELGKMIGARASLRFTAALQSIIVLEEAIKKYRP